MKTLLFIDLYFHTKTSSSNFLFDLLSKEFEIERYYEDEDGLFQGEKLPPIKYREYDVIIYWQKVGSLERLLKVVKANSYCFFPMFDDSPLFNANDSYSVLYWYRLRHFRIISFCRSLYNSLIDAGFDVLYFQYFPPLKPVDSFGVENAVYLWRRTLDVDLKTVSLVNQNFPLSGVHCHNVPDPWIRNTKLDIPLQLSNLVTVSDWYANKEDMRKDIEKCAIYLAPRLKEGIGMSFLEAMAMGRCVIAPNSPTMNEYIVDGKTGILYDCANPVFSLTKETVRKIQKQTLDYINEGYKKWQVERLSICECVQHSIGFYWFNYKNVILQYYWSKNRVKQRLQRVLHLLRLNMPEFLVRGICWVLKRPYHKCNPLF